MMTKTFKITSYLSSLLFLYLFYTLLFAADSFLSSLGLPRSESAIFLAKRAAILMFGFTVLSFFASRIKDSIPKNYVSITLAITWFGLAIMSGYETIFGSIGTGLVAAMIVESILGCIFTIYPIINKL